VNGVFLALTILFVISSFLLPFFLLPAFHAPFTNVQLTTEDWWLEFSQAAKILNALILISIIMVLMNLERTFRSAVGMMRWRIKFFVLGLGVIFGARIYTGTEGLLFSGQSLALAGVETGALLIGCTLMAIAYVRSDFGDVDVYPSRAALHTSLTVVVAGGYLFVVFVREQVVARIG